MTAQQANEFLSKFKLVHQWSDNPATLNGADIAPRPAAEGRADRPQINDEILANTGLSATLIQDLRTGTYTLSIRSTEFRDWAQGGDGERDAAPTDFSGIAMNGFALAQLRALEQYYQWLKDNGHLPAGAQLDVTGYSLGGHLATVFTEVHQNDTDIQFGQTVALNAPGRGTYDTTAGTPKDLIDYYGRVLENPDLAQDLVPIGSDPTTGPAAVLWSAARQMQGQPFDAKTLYNDPRYRWAKYATEKKFDTGNMLLWIRNQLNGVPDQGTADTATMNRITHVFGFETIANTNATANSGIHGQVVRVGIESQPLVEGWSASLKKLFGDDFGNGHSLTLLADSLALQRAMHDLDSSFTLESFIPILASATDRVPNNHSNANYEFDALENILDGLRRMLADPGADRTAFKEGGSGFGDIASREGFYGNLQVLIESPAFQSIAGHVMLSQTDAGLANSARNSFSAMASLLSLSPVSLTATDAASQALLDTALQSAWGDIYTQWQADRDLTPADRGVGRETYSDRWIADRAALLDTLMQANRANERFINDRSLRDAWAYEDLGTDTVLLRQPGPVGATHHVIFGSTADEAVNGGGLEDRLYGGAGDDALSGLGGADYLEGNAGADILEGGAGNDTLLGGADNDRYVFTGTWGHDVITDRDGSLLVDGRPIHGMDAVRVGDSNTWTDKDPAVTYTVKDAGDGHNDLVISFAASGSSITVRRWQSGQLGITLNGTSTQPPASAMYLGDQRAPLTPEGLYDWSRTEWQANGTLRDGVAEADFNDVIRGSAAGDWMQGLGGNDALGGDTGDDLIDGGQGNDLLAGGSGSDTLRGGAGNDVILGGANLTASQRQSALDQWLAPAGALVLAQGSTWGAYQAGTQTSGGAAGNGFPIIQGAGAGVADDGADRIEAGAGNDMVRAGLGNDAVDGGSGNDQLLGDGGSDVLAGGSGDDWIFGDSQANDTLAEDHGRDFLDGGEGSDVLVGGGNADTLLGGDGDDGLWGDTSTGSNPVPAASHGADYLDGGAGNDYLQGQGGADILIGGSGNDILHGDAVEEGVATGTRAGDAIAIAYHGDDFIDGGDGNDQAAGEGGNDTLLGGAGDDRLFGDERATAVGAAGHGRDVLDGEAGDDYLVGEGEADVLLGGEGNDMLLGDDSAANGLDLEFHGADVLDGGAGSDALLGHGGDDMLIGGTGMDFLRGGEGSDVYQFSGGFGSDVVDNRDAGAGDVDRIVFGDRPRSQAAFTREGDNLTVTFAGAADSVSVLGFFSGGATRLEFADGVVLERGSPAFGDIPSGPPGADQFVVMQEQGDDYQAGSGNDHLLGQEGADHVAGGAGRDLIVGGAGSDVLAGEAGEDQLWGGDGNDTLDGGDGFDLVTGGDGDDTIIVGGADQVSGGNGNTTYVIGPNADGAVIDLSATQGGGLARIVFDADIISAIAQRVSDDLLIEYGAGSNTVWLHGYFNPAPGTVNAALRAEFGHGMVWTDATVGGLAPGQSAVFTADRNGSVGVATDGSYVLPQGYASASLTGSGNTALQGNALANVLVGNEGGNAIQGGDGKDLIYGQAGNDSLDGGAMADRLNGGSGNDTLRGGGGEDRLEGGYGDDALDGGAGVDNLFGHDGNDSYALGWGSGHDRLSLSRADSSSTAGQDRIVLDAGIAAQSVSLRRDGFNLVVMLGRGSDRITVDSYFQFYADQDTLALQFADGSVWTASDIAARTVVPVVSIATDEFGIDTVTTDGSYGLAAEYENLSLTGSFDASLYGNYGANVLTGNAGNNVFNGPGFWSFDPDMDLDSLDAQGYWVHSNGADTLIGGAGDDVYFVGVPASNSETSQSDEVIVENAGEGTDRVISYAYSTQLAAHVENLVAFSQSQWWTPDINGNYVPIAHGYVGNDSANIIDASRVRGYAVLDGGGGADTLIGLWGGTTTFRGGAGDDLMLGAAGESNTFQGGAGADTMVGSATGSNTYWVDSLADVLVTQGGSNPGTQTIVASIDYTLPSGINNLSLAFESDYMSDLLLNGTGNDNGNVLRSTNLRSIDAGNGVYLQYGIGDTLAGLAGDDTYYIDQGDHVVEAVDGGTDKVVVQATAAVHAADYANVEVVQSNGIIVGDERANTLIGAVGADTLYGGAGNDEITDTLTIERRALGSDSDIQLQYYDIDELHGNEGDDVLISTLGNDMVFGDAGNDTIYFRDLGYTVQSGWTGNVINVLPGGGVSFGRGDGNDTVSGSLAMRFTGDVDITDLSFSSHDADLLVTLDAAAGSITFKGVYTEDVASGAQTLSAQVTFDGSDRFRFEDYYFDSRGSRAWGALIAARVRSGNSNLVTQGDDHVIGGRGADALEGAGGNDQLFGGRGSDTLSGGAGDDLLLGGDGDDVLSGGPSGEPQSDVLNGGYGNDVYQIEAGAGSIRVFDTGGTDTIQFGVGVRPSDVRVINHYGIESLDGTLSVDLGSAFPKGAETQYGNETENSAIEQVRFADGTVWTRAQLLEMAMRIDGTADADTLEGTDDEDHIFGYAGNDVIDAGSGNDLLDGGTGNDTLRGGAGDDTYVVDSTADGVFEASDAGTDTVQSTVTRTLGSNLENLTLLGSSAINANGNALGNVLLGNSAANTLNGGGGADTMAGGAGNDTYVVDSVLDAVVEAADEGTDLVQSAVTYTLTPYVENLTLTGAAAANGTGNGLDNVLTGNSAANVLAGRAGNDTYVVGTGDTVTELAGEGTDTVQSGVTWTLASDVENLTLTGSAAVNATGNGLDNLLTGNSGANVLTGRAGNDSYVVGTGDTVTELDNEGVDTVLSAATYTLGNYLENLTLTGTSGANGTGNALGNVLLGNAAANTLSGLAGNDTYDGGAGNDALTDSVTTSADVYRFGLGYGTDTITDAGGMDRVELGAGITQSQLVFRRNGNNLELTISGQADKLIVANWYTATANRIEEFRLANGTVVSPGLIPATAQASVAAAADVAAPIQPEPDAWFQHWQHGWLGGWVAHARAASHALPAALGSHPSPDQQVQSLVSAMAAFGATAGSTDTFHPHTERPHPQWAVAAM